MPSQKNWAVSIVKPSSIKDASCVSCHGDVSVKEAWLLSSGRCSTLPPTLWRRTSDLWATALGEDCFAFEASPALTVPVPNENARPLNSLPKMEKWLGAELEGAEAVEEREASSAVRLLDGPVMVSLVALCVALVALTA